MPFSTLGAKRLVPAFLAAVIVVGLGAVDDWYGRFDYAGDAVSYLDVSQAIRHGDGALVFSPYWSIGYPLILAASRWLFPAGPQGEWTAIHVVNLALFVAAYLSFLYLLRVAQTYLATVSRVRVAPPDFGFVFTIGTACFVLLQLLIGNVARVSPDLSVSGVFFLGTAESLQFAMQARSRTAVLLGLLMGVGYLLKTIFLPLSATLFLVVVVRIATRRPAARAAMLLKLAWAVPAMAVVVVPYVAANSSAVGFFSLGESGGLNYAWSVNHLPQGIHWQGGPGDAGRPIHPTAMVLTSPHVFAFAEPFHVTYPPWFNPFYWNEGYRQHFKVGNQLAALEANLTFLGHFFLRGPRAITALALAALGLFFLKERMIWWRRLLALWPFHLPSILAVGIYVMVVIEPRYLVGFLIVILTAPLVALFTPSPLISPRASFALTLLVVLACAAVLVENEKDPFLRMIHHECYLSNDQWKAGLYLAEIGLPPGEKVAAVHGGLQCTWAKVSGAQIVAELGENIVAPNEEESDFHLFARDPAVQQTVFALFRQAGAKLAVVRGADVPLQGPGWEQVPGTAMWFHGL